MSGPATAGMLAVAAAESGVPGGETGELMQLVIGGIESRENKNKVIDLNSTGGVNV